MADLGGSQISALLESVPGIRNVLRSPVADALVNTIRASAGLRPFSFEDVEELVQYAVRRGLIGESEGEEVVGEVRGIGPRRGRSKSKGTSTAKRAGRTRSGGTKPRAKAPAKKRSPARRPAKKR